MDVALIGIGSRGDLEPYLALGETLRDRGHRVRVATHGDAASMVRRSGLDYRPLPGSATAFLAQESLAEAMRKAPTVARLRQMLARPRHAELAAQATLVMRRYVDEATAGADLAVCGPAMQESMSMAPLSVPHALASWYPATPTGAFAAFGAPDLPLGPAYRRLTHHVVDRMVRRQLRPSVAAGRRMLGRRGAPRPPVPVLTFYLVSQAVLPSPGWRPHTVLTGPWERSRAAIDDGPSRSWWEAGPPPVVVSFGSLWKVIPESWVELIVDTVQLRGHRVVVVGGPRIRTDENRRQCNSLDFATALPRAHALVHHGGFGTGTSALRAGLPQVITPLFIDHPWWARRMHELGVAPAPLRLGAARTRPESARAYCRRLNRALGQVDETMRERARSLARGSLRDGGAAEAADLLERWDRDRMAGAPA